MVSKGKAIGAIPMEGSKRSQNEEFFLFEVC
jgi:hypothetical protein